MEMSQMCQIMKPKSEFYDSKYQCTDCLKAKVMCLGCQKIILKKTFPRHVTLCPNL